MPRLLQLLGMTLLLAGLGHSFGVIFLYALTGLPDLNRVMLNVWVAEAHFLGGGLFIAAFRNIRRGAAWQTLALFAALTTIGFTAAILPVLLSRRPLMLSAAPCGYLLCSLVILGGVVREAVKRHGWRSWVGQKA
jgi:hypothetical protein